MHAPALEFGMLQLLQGCLRSAGAIFLGLLVLAAVWLTSLLFQTAGACHSSSCRDINSITKKKRGVLLKLFILPTEFNYYMSAIINYYKSSDSNKPIVFAGQEGIA